MVKDNVMWLVSPFATITRSPLRWLIGLLAIGALLLAGCDSDDDDDACNITNARVSQANSVFRVFDAQGENCFRFEGGFFGPAGGGSSPTLLCFSEVQAEAQPPIGRFLTNPDDPNEPEGEGGVDGSDSCNYTYDVTPGTTIPCPLCDIVVNATDIPPGGQGSGTMELHLALERTPDTIANPPLRSDLIPVTVGTNAQCTVTSINGMAVTQDPAN
jgi:hypothetical protein